MPFARAFGALPIVGPIYERLISGHDLMTYFAFLLVPLTYWALYRTRFGLRLRAIGENPAAVDTAGISVRALRYGAVMICGVLVGLAGVYLALSQEAYFQPHMSAGRGFIALAALVFAKWRPWPALATCLLFGFLDALAIRMQGVALPVIGPVPVQAIEALPYILTVVLLAGFIGKAIRPRRRGSLMSKSADAKLQKSCSRPPRQRRPTPTRPIRASGRRGAPLGQRRDPLRLQCRERRLSARRLRRSGRDFGDGARRRPADRRDPRHRRRRKP